jgi:signal transduction histidine kinase
MNLYFFPPFLASLLLLILGIFVLIKIQTSLGNLPFSFVCFVSFIWLFSYSFAYNSRSETMAYFWFKLGYPGIVLLPVCFFHFTVNFLRLKKFKPFVLLCYFWAISMIFLIWKTQYFIKGIYRFFWGYYPIAGIIHPFFLITFFLLANFSFVLLAWPLFIKRKEVSLMKRNQIEYILVAFIIYTVASIDFLPNYHVPVYPFGYLPTFFFVAIISYSIVRYRVMDIAIAITRTSIFVTIYSLILGIPFFLAYYTQQFFIKVLGDSWWIVPLVSSTILATVGPFVYLYINSRAEERILKEQKSYQNILKGASSGMIRIKNLDHLLRLIVYVVAKIVKIKHVAVYLLDNENQQFSLRTSRMSPQGGIKYFNLAIGTPLIQKLTSGKEVIVAEEILMRSKDEPNNISLSELTKQLSELNASLVIPSFVEDRLIGILVLGEKRSGKLYSQDDLAVFSVVANQAALAIENAQFYDEIKRTNEQLFQAEKMATIGTMADGLSHQINNRFHALSLIAGDSLDMLKTFDWSNCNEETKQIFSDLKSALQRIESNVLQGGEVVKGLLRYSRPGNGGFEAISIRDVVNGALEMVQYKIKIKEIDLAQNLPNELPKLLGNITQLQEVFFNLIDNAYDAIKERQNSLKEERYKGKIEISGKDINGFLEITVKDNGIGVKDLDMKKLFTPFFTTKSTAKKGTGLGLYVIEKIVFNHNGKLKVDSSYQDGTNFVIQLPTTK